LPHKQKAAKSKGTLRRFGFIERIFAGSQTTQPNESPNPALLAAWDKDAETLSGKARIAFSVLGGFASWRELLSHSIS
jgi:hypothetical protein